LSELPTFPKVNNLEWLRLLFALQVLLVHTCGHLGYSVPDIIKHFPGVPAFFFVSGFLIYTSYLNAPGIKYFQNRFLRVFPGLVFVSLGGLAVVVVAKGWSFVFEHFSSCLIWFIAQITLGQVFNPGLFRDIGVGVINGSLWTITTEILFYLFVPVLIFLEKHFRHTVCLLSLLSFVFYVLGPSTFAQTVYRDRSLFEVLSITPITWGWMFGLGILAIKHFQRIERVLPYFGWFLLPMIIMIFYGNGVIWGATGNRLGVVYFICYLSVVLWIAFALPKIPLPFDLSYGLYVWHMPIINLFLVLGIQSISASIGLSLVLAILSWFLVEKPTLKLKKYTLRT
jgi:peptidoglycan/LPS O-acetylase OafA/YrhL